MVAAGITVPPLAQRAAGLLNQTACLTVESLPVTNFLPAAQLTGHQPAGVKDTLNITKF